MKKSTRSRTALLCSTTLVAVMLAQRLTPGDCFYASVVSSPVRGSVIQYFRTSFPDGRTAEPIIFSNASPTVFAESPDWPTQRGKLPTWLSIPEGHLAESNLHTLQKVMRESFFAEAEILQVSRAIEQASGGNSQLTAGAAEFCLILAETMEMGVNALLAAAFHYCCCVMARERNLAWSTTTTKDLSSATDSLYQIHPSLEGFGEHVASIARDAARLKRLEWVADRVMQEHSSARVRPDKRDAENLKKLLLSETKDWRALAIRSAACLYRLRGLLKTNPTALTPEAARTGREALYIYAPLASQLGMHRLKNELEGAAFRILYRRQYEAVTSITHEHPRAGESSGSDIGEAMQNVLEKVRDEITAMLKDDTEFSVHVENFSVTARVKEPYSMWKKMLGHGYKHVLQVPDALALRIVLDAKKVTPNEPAEVTRARERALCYYAQKLCTERWRPVEGNPRFKDYIERPKVNGYQSLHYTAHISSGDQDWTVEIQVRSGEMHQVAEFGLASHWDYKASQQRKGQFGGARNDVSIRNNDEDIDNSSLAYLRNVQQWHWQQHGGARMKSDSHPVPNYSVAVSDISQGHVLSERIRSRAKRLEPYIEALSAAQSDLARDYVFVFMSHSSDTQPSEGKVVALPAGACVLDALRVGRKTYGFELDSSRDGDLILNGDTTSITKQLHNGDILTIPTAAYVAT